MILLYLGAIVMANLTVTAFGPVAVIPNSLLLIGLDITCRDVLHDRWHGHHLPLRMAALIATGSILSWLLNRNAGPIALASFVAFAAAATADTLVYTWLEDREWFIRSNGSNLVSAAVDSVAFVSLAFGWLPWLILGQFVAKTLGGLLWSWLLQQHRTAVVRSGA